MDQLDFFDLVDAENFTVLIHYLDARGVRHTEALGTSKSNYNANIQKWRDEHPRFYFLFCET